MLHLYQVWWKDGRSQEGEREAKHCLHRPARLLQPKNCQKTSPSNPEQVPDDSSGPRRIEHEPDPEWRRWRKWKQQPERCFVRQPPDARPLLDHQKQFISKESAAELGSHEEAAEVTLSDGNVSSAVRWLRGSNPFLIRFLSLPPTFQIVFLFSIQKLSSLSR